MQGEVLDAVAITGLGLLGDRAYALVDLAEGKVVSAKNPRKWGKLIDFRAQYAEPPAPAAPMPPVLITLPDGTPYGSTRNDIHEVLSRALDRPVELRRPVPVRQALEIYWPEMQGLPHQDAVTDQLMPPGTFFDEAHIHLLSTATLERLQQLHQPSQWDVRRFRPNIVVAPIEDRGFVENGWVQRTLAIGSSVRLNVFRACPRCIMTTMPQGDLPRDPEVLRTVVQNNRGNAGVRANVIQGGTIQRGDVVYLA